MKAKLIALALLASVTTGVGAFFTYHLTAEQLSYHALEASLAEGTARLGDGTAPSSRSSYDLSAHQTLSRVILLIREHYVDPERVDAFAMFMAALNTIARNVPEVLIDDTGAPERVRVSVGAETQTFDLGGLDQLWEVTMALRDIFRFLQGQIEDPDQRRDIEYAAINGMLSTLDPHSILLEPDSFNEMKLSTKGEFGGLGIVISIRDGALTVISPIEGTPAARSGIKAKDKIAKIGEESTINMNLEEAVQRLRGKPGTKIDIWVQRQGWQESRRITITRAIIKIESVTSELLADGIGYIKIKSFQNNTYDDLHTHLERLRKRRGGEIRGLVLDLRNNPGGLLDQAILVSDRFVDNGPLVITVGEGNRQREEKAAHYSGTDRDYPIAVLVNGGSASASEIVAGALKNHDRAVLVGQQTFGKGSVQVLYDFKDHSALKLTIAQYLTPGDISIQSVGVMPDIEVQPVQVSKERMHLFVDDDSPREKDLDHHLERGTEAKAPVAAQPEAQVLHLVTAGEQEQQEADEAAEKFRLDFEIALARDMLAASPSTKRQDILTAAGPLLERRRAEQDERISGALRELGVMWDKGGVEGADIHASVVLEEVAKPAKGAEILRPVGRDSSARAGEIVRVTATVANRGTKPAHRLHGVTSSDNRLFHHLELAFGRLDPGQSKSWSVDVKLPEDLGARADKISLEVRSGVDEPLAEAQTVLLVQERAQPTFSYSYRIDDAAPKQNGDGVLQVGERVHMKIRVSNVGPGTAEEVVATVKNLTGSQLFLEEGRSKVGNLAVGAEGEATLAFTLREPVDAVKLRIALWDTALGAGLSDEISIPVEPVRTVEKTRGGAVRVRGAAETPLYGGASTRTPPLAYARSGATLRVDATYDDGWTRVLLGDGTTAFLAPEGGERVRAAPKALPQTALRLVAPQAAPLLNLEQPQYLTTKESLQLVGQAHDAHDIKDVYVFVNDKKVYYRALGDQVEASPQGGKTAKLDLTLPLIVGTNNVSVVVRETPNLVTRRVFGIYRAAPDAEDLATRHARAEK